MSNKTLILTVPGESTDPNQPIAYADAIMNAGTKWLIDFTNPACNSNAAGTLSAGAIFKNLVAGAANASVVSIGGDSAITNNLDANGNPTGLVFSGTTGSRYVSLGTSFDLHLVNHAFVVSTWAKVGTGFNNNSGIVGLGSGTPAAQQQYTIEGAFSGTNLAGGAGGVTNNAILTPAGVFQAAVSWSPTGIFQFFLNGALVAQSAAPATLFDASANNTNIGADPANIVFRGTIYRAFQEDLTLSGMTAQAVVTNDYQMNLGRFA